MIDSTKGLLVWEQPWYPHYYFPASEIKNASIGDVVTDTASPVTLTVAARKDQGIDEATTDRVLRFGDAFITAELAGLVRLEFGSMGTSYPQCTPDPHLLILLIDQWLEEDMPIYMHPKDPFRRIDILPSTRTIEVRVGGKTVAKSSFAMHLFETGLRTRYYLPLGSVDPGVLRDSKLVTKCPYKGEAEYYNVVVAGQTYKDVAWYYRNPIQESIGIADLVCFYNEKVDILVDGEAA